jgi:FkbM family methyltransferase
LNRTRGGWTLPKTMKTDPLCQILGLDLAVHVVDVGANPIDGDAPYAALLAAGRARLVGFEPNPEALAALEQRKGPHERYFPHAIGDGEMHTLHVCQAPGMTSLLQPNAELLARFHGFSAWGTVIRTLPVATVRLDDVAEIEDLDYLKIDIQGGELMALTHAAAKLRLCTVIQTEVEFLPMYRDQPLFSEIEQFLRAQGFVIHKFEQLTTRTLQPLLVDDSIYGGISQIFWADAVFVRDFTQLHALPADKLLRAALILHDVYRSYDLAAQFLLEHDRRTEGGLAARYFEALGD